MNDTFNPSHGPILIEAGLSGPAGQADIRLVLDTGATTSLVRPAILQAVGYEPDASRDRIQVAMGNGVESVPRVTLNRLSALGRHRLSLPVLDHPLPPEAGADGLLGLDFFRQSVLTIDFPAGRVSID